ncbi:MAG: hypothetical protein E5V63_08275 [Mesorhizobium sp.]|nr:MAG: hypothetical protein E5V63_08275 [Mesorhizobium sp.]
MERKVILGAVLLLVALGAYQAATGGIKPSISAEQRADCDDALSKLQQYRQSGAANVPEGTGPLRVRVSYCRDLGYFTKDQVAEVAG